MTMGTTTRLSLLIVLAATVAPSSLMAGQLVAGRSRPLSSPQDPIPEGQRIDANDGDVIAIDGDARVRILRHRQARVRIVFNAAQRWLVVLADYPSQSGGAPDGRVDSAFSYSNVEGEWPLGERWEGDVVLEEYSVAGSGGPRGLGVVTAQGMLQLFSPPEGDAFRNPRAAAVLSYRGTSGGVSGRPFDEAEQQQVAQTIRNAELQARSPGVSVMTTEVAGGVAVSSMAAQLGRSDPTRAPNPDGPVRVGGNIARPRKISDVPPVMPEVARQARVFGIVVVEVTVGADGAVTDAKILRSIPMLDTAALDAVRQWRYEPTYLNGKPVAAILTETVTFSP